MRYFWDNPANYKEHRLPLAEIKGLSDRAETDYYTRLPVGYEKTGQALYNWLDKSDRVLANALREPHQESLIIAIATDKGLAHLPWELQSILSISCKPIDTWLTRCRSNQFLADYHAYIAYMQQKIALIK